jgi:hypothetical protein
MRSGLFPKIAFGTAARDAVLAATRSGTICPRSARAFGRHGRGNLLRHSADETGDGAKISRAGLLARTDGAVVADEGVSPAARNAALASAARRVRSVCSVHGNDDGQEDGKRTPPPAQTRAAWSVVSRRARHAGTAPSPATSIPSRSRSAPETFSASILETITSRS